MDKEKFAKLFKKDIIESLDSYFEISTIKEEDFLVRSVRRRIAEKLEHILDLLSSYLNPGSDLLETTDAECFSEEDRDKILSIIKIIVLLYKKHQSLEVESVESEEKDFCIEALHAYKKFAVEVKALISKTAETYNKDDIKADIAHYLG
jgi:hypothetical protein